MAIKNKKKVKITYLYDHLADFSVNFKEFKVLFKLHLDLLKIKQLEAFN